MKDIELINIYRGKKRMRINGLEKELLYENYFGSNTPEFLTIKEGSLFEYSLRAIGNKGDAKYFKNNYFELENDRYFCFSRSTYSVVYDKINEHYFPVFKPRNLNISRISKNFEKILKDCLRERQKLGQRLE